MTNYIKKCIYQCKSQKTMNSMKKLGMYNSGPICQHPRAYLGFHIPKGFIGNRTTANSHNPTKWLPQNCVLSLAVHRITHNTGIKCKKIVPKKHASWPKRGEVTSQPTQSTSPGSTPSYPPPPSTYHVKYKQLTSPHISTVAPSSRSLSTINIGVVPGTTMVHGILSFLAE